MQRVTFTLSDDEAQRLRIALSQSSVTLGLTGAGSYRGFSILVDASTIEIGPADAPGSYTEGTTGAAFDQDAR